MSSGSTLERLRASADRWGISPGEISERIAPDLPPANASELSKSLVAEFYAGTRCAMIVAEAIVKLIAEKGGGLPGVRPPEEFARFEEHHLASPGGDTLRFTWARNAWWICGAGPILPEQMAARGWRYAEPAPALLGAPVERAPPPPKKGPMQLFSLGNGVAVCSNPGGRFHGWMFQRHPDGQWVSVQKLSEVELPADPLTSSLSTATASPAVRMPHAIERAVTEAISEFCGGDAETEACMLLARQIIDIVAGTDPAMALPKDPRAKAWDFAAEVANAEQRLQAGKEKAPRD